MRQRQALLFHFPLTDLFCFSEDWISNLHTFLTFRLPKSVISWITIQLLCWHFIMLMLKRLLVKVNVIVTNASILVSGGGVRGAVWVFSGWNYPGLGKLHRLCSLLRLPQRSYAAHPPGPQPALPVCVSASHPACNRGHLRLGWWDQDLALRTLNGQVNIDLNVISVLANSLRWKTVLN